MIKFGKKDLKKITKEEWDNVVFSFVSNEIEALQKVNDQMSIDLKNKRLSIDSYFDIIKNSAARMKFLSRMYHTVEIHGDNLDFYVDSKGNPKAVNKCSKEELEINKGYE